MNKPKQVDPYEPDWDAKREELDIIAWEEAMAMMDAEEEVDDGTQDR